MAKEYPVNLSIGAFDRVTKVFKKIESGFQRLGAAATAFKARTEGVNKAFQNFGQGVSTSFGRLKRVGLYATGAATAFGFFVKKTIDAASELDDVTKRLGFSAKSFQELQFAATQTGMKAGEFSKSIEKLSVNMGELKHNSGPLFSQLKKSAPVFLQQLKGAKNNEEAFNLLIDAMRKIKDPAERAAFATAAFGKQGPKLVNMALEGADGLKKLREQAMIIDPDTLQRMNDFGDQIDQVTNSFFVLATKALGPMIPEFSRLATLMLEWIRSIAPKVEAWAKGFALELPGRIDRLRSGFERLVAMGKPLIDFASWIIEKFGLVETIAVALTTYIAGPMVISFTKLAVVLTKFVAPAFLALGRVMLLNPIGLVITAIGALAAAGYMLVKHWDWVSEKFSKIWKTISDPVKKMFGGNLTASIEAQKPKAVQMGPPKSIPEGTNTTMTKKQELIVSFDNLPPGAKVKMKDGARKDKDFNLLVNSGLQGALSGF